MSEARWYEQVCRTLSYPLATLRLSAVALPAARVGCAVNKGPTTARLAVMRIQQTRPQRDCLVTDQFSGLSLLRRIHLPVKTAPARRSDQLCSVFARGCSSAPNSESAICCAGTVVSDKRSAFRLAPLRPDQPKPRPVPQPQPGPRPAPRRAQKDRDRALSAVGLG